MRKMIKSLLPEKLVWKISKWLPHEPLLKDISRSERLVEYAWAFKNIQGEAILDVGYCGSLFPQALASLGHVVMGLDKKVGNIDHPNFKSMVDNLFTLPTKPLHRFFDTITCISVLEHIAVSGKEKEAFKIMWKMLKPGGVLLLTVPCGFPIVLSGYKVFAPDEVGRLGRWTSIEFFKELRKGVWVNACEGEMMDIKMEGKDDVKAIACAVFQK